MFQEIANKGIDALHTASSSLVSSLVAPGAIKSGLADLVDVQADSTRAFMESYTALMSDVSVALTDRSAYVDLSKKVTTAFPALAPFFPQ